MVELFACALLVVVFLGAVVGKVRSAQGFAEFRDSVAGLTRRSAAAGPVAAAVVGGEAVTVVLLVVPGTRLGGFAVAATLLGIFSIGVAMAVRRRQAIRCRCFGAGGGVLGPRHLVRNGVLITLAAAGVLDVTESTAQSALIAISAGALLGLVTIRWEDVAFLLGRSVPAGRNR